MRKVLAGMPVSLTVLAIALSFAACGKSDSSGSPTGPTSPATTSAQPAPPSGTSAGATIAGTVLSGASASSSLRTMSVGLTVTVVGTSVSATVDASGAFALQHVPLGDIQLQFSGPGVDARLAVTGVTDREEIHITVRVNGTSADVDENERETADNRVEVEGRIAVLNLVARTLRIGDTTVVVPAGTPIRHGGTPMELADLRVGDRVHVQATKNGVIVTATEVVFQTSNPPLPTPTPTPSATPTPTPTPPPDDHHDAQVNGIVAGLGGTCPAVHFTIGATHVTTGATTEFDGGPCSQLANGIRVEVKGTTLSDGSVSALRVHMNKTK